MIVILVCLMLLIVTLLFTVIYIIQPEKQEFELYLAYSIIIGFFVSVMLIFALVKSNVNY